MNTANKQAPPSPLALARQRATALYQDRGIYGKLERSKASIAVRLPKGVDADRWIASLHTEIDRIPKLRQCDPATVLGGAFEIAQMGLQLGAALGQAYLIPYGRTATLILGYKGMIALAMDAGIVESVDAAIVYERDEFNFSQGSDRRLHHVPYLRGPDRGDPIAVYACLYLSNGGHHVAVIPWWEIEKMAVDLGKRGGPWVTHRGEMAKKTAIRRAMKYVRLTPRQASGVHLDELAEAKISQGLEGSGAGIVEAIEAVEGEVAGAIEAEPVEAAEAVDAEPVDAEDPFDPAFFSGGER